jgi:hypothetical protein
MPAAYRRLRGNPQVSVLAPDLSGRTRRRTMRGVTTFCPVTWCNNPLDSTNLTILICYQTHQMTMVSGPLTVLNSE